MLEQYIDGLALLETAGGKKTIKGPNGEDSFNLFNIKDFSGKGFRAHDKAEGSRDAYRVYNSADEAKQDLMGLLERKYPDALKAGSPEEFAAALKKGGYATDPNYVSKLTGAIKRVAAPAEDDSTGKLSALREQGWGADIDYALSQKFSAKEIVSRIEGASKADAAGRSQVATLAATGGSSLTQLQALRKAGWSADIDYALSQKFTPEEIVDRIAGAERGAGMAANQAAESRGVLGNAWEGVKAAAGDAGRGVSQLYSRVTGDDQGLARKQAEQAAVVSDLNRVATMNTTAGTVGNVGAKVVPSLVAAGLTGGGSLLGQAAVQGGVGALQGALTPTTEEGQFGTNVGLGGGLGAIGGAAGGALVKAPAALARGGQKLMRGGQSVEELTAARDALVREGITPSAADISTRAAGTANRLERNIAGSQMGGADARALREPEIARAISSRIGAESDELSSAVVKKAQQNISKMYDEALEGVDVPLGPQFTQALDDIAAKQAGQTLPSLASKLPDKVADDLKALAQGGAVSARQLQAVRSSIGKEMTSGNDPAAKAALGDIRQAINEALEQGLPAENLAKFNKANEYYKNLQPVENYVRRTNDSGMFSPKRFLTSTKAENRAAFERGEAPFQDLMQNLAESQVAGGGLTVDPLTKAVGLGAVAGPAGPVVTGLAGNLAMRILTDPKYTNILLGLNPVQRAALMQQAAASRAGSAIGAQIAAPQHTQPSAQIIPFRRAA